MTVICFQKILWFYEIIDGGKKNRDREFSHNHRKCFVYDVICQQTQSPVTFSHKQGFLNSTSITYDWQLAGNMFSSGPNYNKLKTNLRLTINRLKLLEKKKTEIAAKSRKEIADYISAGKDDRARIRVEHIIREDYLVEAMELLEMYCDLLLARFGLIQTQK